MTRSGLAALLCCAALAACSAPPGPRSATSPTVRPIARASARDLAGPGLGGGPVVLQVADIVDDPAIYVGSGPLPVVDPVLLIVKGQDARLDTRRMPLAVSPDRLMAWLRSEVGPEVDEGVVYEGRARTLLVDDAELALRVGSFLDGYRRAVDNALGLTE